ncbi:MAG: glycosyltransferase family 2 protein [Coriobacteriales bacterium]|jgi:glycosyltransferase involved in cell wall biosynthesis|nr:glycosyltransferase family 2 protein [Coriobacteriales bacterium]
MKVLTYAVPCYNSAAYMDTCIASLIGAASEDIDQVEILIVDDGSTDGGKTAAKADLWQQRFPGVVRALHQSNKGHGGAINTAIRAAAGCYFKCVDSDDWVDVQAAQEVMGVLSAHLDPTAFGNHGGQIDMLISNYVYNHSATKTEKVINFRSVFPRDRVFTWADSGHFHLSQNILMHAVTYRTALLRECGLSLPEHSFYVDNIFVYVPLPYVKRLYYVNANFYQYFIGREGQSVSEEVVLAHVPQQMLITKTMIDAYRLPDEVSEPKLLHYMLNHLTLMMSCCVIFSLLAKKQDRSVMANLPEIWAYLKTHNPGVYWRMRLDIRSIGCSLPTPLGHALAILVYRVAKRLYKFN